MELRGEVSGDDVIVRRLAYSHVMVPPLSHFARRAGELTRDAVRAEAPDGVTHRLKGSIEFAIEGTGARVYTDLDYAPYVEFGTRPHMPPVGAISAWAASKGIPPWALATHIKKAGTKANAFFRRGFEKSPRGLRGLIAILARDIERAGSSG